MRLSSRTIYCIQCASICIKKIVHKGSLYSLTGLPYVQKVLYSEGPMFRGSYVQKIFVQKVRCSDGLIFRRSYVHKVLCSEIFVQKILYLEITYLFGRLYIQKVLCSEGPIFSRSFVQKVLCWNTFPSFSFRYKKHLPS